MILSKKFLAWSFFFLPEPQKYLSTFFSYIFVFSGKDAENTKKNKLRPHKKNFTC
jgi:hypothetical protein